MKFATGPGARQSLSYSRMFRVPMPPAAGNGDFRFEFGPLASIRITAPPEPEAIGYRF